jgi:DNA-binding response OmpR family regulator
MKKILIIEDELRMAALLMRGFETNAFEVTLAPDGASGLKLALEQSYDAIITDIMLPKISGIELCKIIKSKLPKIPILMLTALGTTDEKLEGFDAGADDYLVKPFEMRELIARIKVLLKRYDPGEIQTIASTLTYSNLVLDNKLMTVKRANTPIHLTPKEFKLLRYLMQNPNCVITRSEIAENVWKTNFDTGTNFIDVYINYLRNKIDKPFEPKLIHTKPGLGFIFSENKIV